VALALKKAAGFVIGFQNAEDVAKRIVVSVIRVEVLNV
jgi:hypothetical protein